MSFNKQSGLELPSGRYLNPHKIPNDVSPIAHIAVELLALSAKTDKVALLLRECPEIVDDKPSSTIISLIPGLATISKKTLKQIDNLCHLSMDKNKKIALLATKTADTWMEPLECSRENRNILHEAILCATLVACPIVPFPIHRYLCYSDCIQNKLHATPENLANASMKLLKYAEIHFCENGWKESLPQEKTFTSPEDTKCWPTIIASKWSQPLAIRMDLTDRTLVFQI